VLFSTTNCWFFLQAQTSKSLTLWLSCLWTFGVHTFFTGLQGFFRKGIRGFGWRLDLIVITWVPYFWGYWHGLSIERLASQSHWPSWQEWGTATSSHPPDPDWPQALLILFLSDQAGAGGLTSLGPGWPLFLNWCREYSNAYIFSCSFFWIGV